MAELQRGIEGVIAAETKIAIVPASYLVQPLPTKITIVTMIIPTRIT